MWLGLSDIDTPGKLHWVNGSEMQEGEEIFHPRSMSSRGNVCVFLEARGQTSPSQCNAKRPYMCQYTAEGKLTDMLSHNPNIKQFT